MHAGPLQVPTMERVRRAAGAEPPSIARGEGLERFWGHAAAVGAAAFAGLIPVFAKRDLGGVDPLLVAGFNNLFAGLILLPLAPVPRFDKPDRRRVLFIALAGAVIAPPLYFLGLRSTTASEGAMLVNTETVFTLMLALLILKEHAGKVELACVAAIIAGAVVLTTNLQLSIEPAHLAGNLLIVASTAVWAFDNTVSTGLARRNPPPAVAAWKNLSGSSVVLVIALAVAVDFSTVPSHLSGLLIVGALGTGVSLVFFYIALRRIGAYRTSAIFGLQGIFGAAGGYILVGDRLSVAQLGASALMIAAVLMLALQHRQTSPPAPGSETRPPVG